jgi:hypothetical protein
MKTHKNLFPTITSFGNLYQAYRGAARGKRGQPNVAAFELDLEDNLLRLQQELQAKRYRPAPYYSGFREPARSGPGRARRWGSGGRPNKAGAGLAPAQPPRRASRAEPATTGRGGRPPSLQVPVTIAGSRTRREQQVSGNGGHRPPAPSGSVTRDQVSKSPGHGPGGSKNPVEESP